MRRKPCVLALLVGVLVLPEPALAAPADVTLSPDEISRCLDRNPRSREASAAVPSLVDGSPTLQGPGLSPRDRVFGRGALWVWTEAVHRPAGYDIDSGDWEIGKFPWFRTRPARIKARAERLDGPGTFNL